MKKAYIITIEGRVQGVGFRYFTSAIAKELDIKGYTRNTPDGNVYIVAEGEERDLNKFIIQCNKGPILARVTKLITKETKVSDYDQFRIR
ncbi:MAG: acylphosphatase [Hyphomicrobiales bacterium]